MKRPLIVIGGPTACGKTAVSVKLAKELNTEIISADSMQVYKYMDIGTAKVTEEEKEGVKHYLIDELMPDEEFSIAVFQKLAKKYMDKIYSENKVPIIAGGTGFYINSLVYDTEFTDTETNNALRERLFKQAEEYGADYVHSILEKVDPEAAQAIHPNNIKRVIRAIEFFEQTGTKISDHNKEEKQKDTPYNVAFIILTMDRQKLYERINARVDKMVEEGVVEEAKRLIDMGYGDNLVSMKAIGYKEFFPYFKGEKSLDECIYDLKINTRHFAKRQLTWFKGQTDGLWLDITNLTMEEIICEIKKYLADKKII